MKTDRECPNCCELEIALNMAITERTRVWNQLVFWRVLAIGFFIIGTICFAILK